MMKKKVMLLAVFLLVLSIFVSAQSSEEECGFWCKVNEFLFGREEAVVGKSVGDSVPTESLNPEVERLAARSDAEATEAWAREVVEEVTAPPLTEFIVDSVTYTRTPRTATFGSEEYSVYMAPDNEWFVFYDNKWRQVEGSWTTDGKSNLHFVTPSGGSTDDPEQADISTLLTAENTQALRKNGRLAVTAAPPAPPAAPAPVALINIPLNELTGTITPFTPTPAPGAPATAPPTATPAGGPELVQITGGPQIPKTDVNEFFGKEGGNIVWRGNAGFKDGVLRNVRGEIVSYEQNGQVKKVGDNVNLWTGNKYSGDLSSETYGKYGSAIDPTKINENTFGLKDGGSLTEINDPKSGARILSVTTKPTKETSKTETTITLANGQEVTLDEPVNSLGDLPGKRARFNGEDAEVYMQDNALIVKTDDEEIATEKLNDGRVQTTTTDLDSRDETVEIRNMQTNEVETLKYDEDRLDSWVVRDKKGNVIGRAEIEDGKVEQFNSYDENGDLRSVRFYENGDPDKLQREITIISEDKVAVTTGGSTTTYTEEEIERMLKSNPNDPFAKQLQKAQEAAESDAFWSFNPQRSSFWNFAAGREFKAQQYIGSIMSIRPGWHGISNLFAPEVTADMRAWADEKFAKAMLLDRASVALSEVCREEASIPGENARFMRTRSGTYQFVGSIQAEKTEEKIPILCVPNPDEEADEDELWICPTENYVCRQDFCYQDENDANPVEGHYYKITWGVTAPQDEAFTPYIDEDGIAVKFNLQFTGADFWLYESEHGHADINSILLTNGESDGGTIVHYSPQDFDEVCILFGAPPEDWLGDAVNKICSPVETVSEKEAEESSSYERGSRTTSSGRVQVNSNW